MHIYIYILVQVAKMLKKNQQLAINTRYDTSKGWHEDPLDGANSFLCVTFPALCLKHQPESFN